MTKQEKYLSQYLPQGLNIVDVYSYRDYVTYAVNEKNKRVFYQVWRKSLKVGRSHA